VSWCTNDHAGHGLAAQVEQALDVEEVGGLALHNMNRYVFMSA
jgi:hypothetical protein